MDFSKVRRYNEKNCHKKSSKHINLVIEKHMKQLLTKKYTSSYCSNRIWPNPKLGRKRRTYYHDNKYIDPWILSSNSHKKIHTEDFSLPNLNNRDKNYRRVWAIINDAKIKQGIIKYQDPIKEDDLKKEDTEENLHIENKKIYKSKNKIKLVQYSCILMTTDQASFRNLCHYLY